MKVNILNLKTQFLLGAGLDVLHFESGEWLDTIAFWKDEVKFFDNLLKKKGASESNHKDYGELLKNLDKIYTDLFDDLEDSIVEHEQLLSRILQKEKGVSDSDYRKKHRLIRSRINTFTSDFKTFKRIVFDYAKSL